jgi:hypothetical protein
MVMMNILGKILSFITIPYRLYCYALGFINIPKDLRVKEELTAYLNHRFEYSFQCPIGWDKQEPVNTDGCVFISPRSAEIKMICWGAWEHLEEKDDYMGIEEEYSCGIPKEIQSYIRGIKLFSTASNKRIEFCGEDKTAFGKSYRLVFLTRSGIHLCKVMMVVTKVEKRFIGVSCEAPLSLFPYYEDMFIEIVSSLKMLKVDLT